MVLKPPIPESDEYAHFRTQPAVRRQTGVQQRELRRGNRVLNEDVHLPDVFLRKEPQRIEIGDLAAIREA